MKASECYASKPSQPDPITWRERLLLALLRRAFRGQSNSLQLTLPSGAHHQLGEGDNRASLRLNSFRPFMRLLTGGINGWSEAYLAGEWDSPDLTELMRWGIRHEAELKRLAPARAFTGTIHNLYHRRRNNSREGSQRNIAAHYDLGNAFYAQWLDESMTYSAGLFASTETDLGSAQRAKYDRILALLNARDGEHIAEVGCGWGGFAVHAAREAALRVHGVTLSPAQLAWAKEKVEENDLGEQVHLSLTDYRDLVHQYDGVVSIEMFEAVGEAHWDSYFEMLNRILKPGGRAVLQIITIDEARFGRYRKQADFIQRYVFPGGMLPSDGALRDKFREHNLTLVSDEQFGQDYAKTLVHWSERFESNWDAIEAEGFDDHFRRLWRYYLAYCRSGFEEGAIDVGLYVLERPESA